MEGGEYDPVTQVDTELIAAAAAVSVAIEAPPRPLTAWGDLVVRAMGAAWHYHVQEPIVSVPNRIDDRAGSWW